MLISLISALFLILVYTWVLYPLILRLLASLSSSPSLQFSTPPPLQFPVSIILSAYNEEAHIGARLENLLALDYPQDLIQIHVGLDGCDDHSADIAQSIAAEHPNIHVHDFEERRGKVPVLKELVAYGRDDSLLVFTDANTMFRPDALQKLVAPFAVPGIGGVCGRLIFREIGSGRFSQDPAFALRGYGGQADGEGRGSGRLGQDDGEREGGGRGQMPEGAYWGWETKLKIAESALDSCLGANGAIYAMRPELFWRDMPDNTLIDDFVLGMKVREQGFRMVYEPDAVAEEELPETAHEWTRRVRIGAGAYQALSLCRRALLPLGYAASEDGESNTQQPTRNVQCPSSCGPKGRTPLHNWTFLVGCWMLNSFRSLIHPWTFFSHKVLRWFTPHLLLALAILLAATLFRIPNSRILQSSNPVILGVIIAVLSLTSCWCARSPRASLLRHFLTMQAALFVGFIRYCRGGLGGAWTRTPRGDGSGSRAHE